jgi:hypothetical protein
MVLTAGPAMAKKKKATSDEPAQQATDEEKEKSAAPAAQVGDTEKPHTIIDTSQEAPKTDSLGHVHFASPSAAGIGRVAIKALPDDKIKVFLEGRYFGIAPLTIYSVPKGDYILEATYPSGKQVSKPVTVGENEETAVDLGGATALSGSSAADNMFNAEMTPNRLLWTKIFLIGAGVGVVGAVAFGILELKTEGDYNDTPAGNQARRDELANTGKRYALLTNVGIVMAAVGLVGAAVTGYPLIFKSGEKKTVMLTPALGPGITGAAATIRF